MERYRDDDHQRTAALGIASRIGVALNLALTTLMTVNAIGVGMAYSTMRTAMSFTAKTDERDSYALGVIVMVVISFVGVLSGIVHMVWRPEQVGLLLFAAFGLVSAPALELVLLLAKRNGMQPTLNEQFWNRYDEAGLQKHGRKMKGLYAESLSRVWREPEVEHLAGLIEMTAFHGPEGQDAASIEA